MKPISNETERLKATYDGAREPVAVVNKGQAIALAALLERGELLGVRYEDVEPPESVVLVGMGERSPGYKELLGDDAFGPANSLGVVANDGRCWVIAAAGITWPRSEGRGEWVADSAEKLS